MINSAVFNVVVSTASADNLHLHIGKAGRIDRSLAAVAIQYDQRYIKHERLAFCYFYYLCHIVKN